MPVFVPVFMPAGGGLGSRVDPFCREAPETPCPSTACVPPTIVEPSEPSTRTLPPLACSEPVFVDVPVPTALLVRFVRNMRRKYCFNCCGDGVSKLAVRLTRPGRSKASTDFLS